MGAVLGVNYENVMTYNKISRFELKLPARWTGVDKNQICENIFAMQDDAKFKLLSKLVAIKYYRQTGCLTNTNNVEDPEEQNKLWRSIQEDTSLLPDQLGLLDLMMLIKNDGFIIQPKFPPAFKTLLLRLSESEREELVNSFAPDLSNTMGDFLTNATGEIWPERTREQRIQADAAAVECAKKCLKLHYGDPVEDYAQRAADLAPLAAIIGPNSSYSVEAQKKIRQMLEEFLITTKNKSAKDALMYDYFSVTKQLLIPRCY